MWGGLLALLAAASFAFSNVSARRGVIGGSVVQGLMVTIPIGVPLFLAAVLATGSLGAAGRFSPLATLYLALAGIAHFVWGRYCSYRAISAMGGNLAGPVQQVSLLLTLALAVSLLGEILTPLRILGITLVLIGPAVMLRARKAASHAAKSEAGPPASSVAMTSFRPRYAEGYTFAFLSAFGYGLSPILVRAALQGADAGASLSGGLISYAAATALVAPVLLRRATRRHVLSVDRQAAKWFTVSGVVVCVSQMVRYLALALAPVTVVAPILRTSIVFRVLFGWIVNRDHEVFGLGMVIGLAVSLVGAVALTLDTEFVLSFLPLPDFAIEAAQWHWPRG